MRIPLEDGFQDVIGKARRGSKFSESALVQKAGIELEQLEALQAGHFDLGAVAKIADVLELDPAALIALGRGSWYPEAPYLPATFAAFNTPFEDMTVNSYLVWDREGGRAAAFDTGGDSAGMLGTLRAHGLTLDSIFLTHTHCDHIAALDELTAATGAAVYVPAAEQIAGAAPVEEGASFTAAGFTISARLTAGHSPGGTTWTVAGMGLAIVGDALFAGSMGGVPPEKYAAALQATRDKILSLPADTILCSGHGPLTTVRQERRHNPFYAGNV